MFRFLVILLVVWRMCLSAPSTTRPFPEVENKAEDLFEGDIKLTKLQEENVNRAIKKESMTKRKSSIFAILFTSDGFDF